MHAKHFVPLLAVAGLLASAPSRSPPGSMSSTAAEHQADQRMWAVMHQMLMDFGYTNQAHGLNQAWQQNLPAPAQPPAATAAELSRTVAQIAAACRPLRRLDAALQLACAQSPHPHIVIQGLLQWTIDGGSPTLQGRADLALHFLYAAAAEVSLGVGDAVSLAKEYFDRSQGKPFDLDDLAAGLAGAEWVRQARQDPNWLQAWATGRRSLSNSLPPLRYGTGLASDETLAKIQREIASAMRRPES